MKKSKKVSKEVKKDKTDILLIIAIIIVGILLAGVTYAFFSSSDTSTSKIVKSGSLEIEYIDSSDNIDSIDTIPINDSEIKTKANKIEFNVSNTGSRKAYVDISLIDIVMSSELINLEFKWALYSGDTKISNGNFRNVLDNKQLLMNNIEIDSSVTKTYQLYIWISESGLDQSNTMDKEFKCKIEIIGNLKEGAKLLSQVIKENNSPITTTKPNFANIADTDEGLIQDVDKDGETYYFRGDVKDNYLKIEGLTWPTTYSNHTAGDDMLFRIVRINGSRTIRIISDDSIGKSKYNDNRNSEEYVGYTYREHTSYKIPESYSSNHTKELVSGTIYYYSDNVTIDSKNGGYTLVDAVGHTPEECFNNKQLCVGKYTQFSTNSNKDNHLYKITQVSSSIEQKYRAYQIKGEAVFDENSEVIDSTIKKYLDNWYDNEQGNIKKYNNIFANERYCNDTKKSFINNSGYLYYPSYNRLRGSYNLTFECSLTDKTYGGEYDLKIGLLTADEAAFAGGVFGSDNSKYYLVKNEKNIRLSSPYYFMTIANVLTMNASGNINLNDVIGSSGVSPVLNLKSDTPYYSGNGTSDNPYIVKLK